MVLGLVPSSAVPSNKDVIHVTSLESTGQKNQNILLYIPISVCQLSVSNMIIPTNAQGVEGQDG